MRMGYNNLKKKDVKVLGIPIAAPPPSTNPLSTLVAR